MSALYLDSSAFVKLIVEEAETIAVRAYVGGHVDRRVSSALLRTEAMRAVRHLGPDARGITREALRRVDLVALDDRILDAAGILEPAVLRTLDAIHLATAMSIGDDLTAIVTYDTRMIEAARSLGLPTISPN